MWVCFTSGMPTLEELGRNRIKGAGVVFEEFAAGVNDDVRLEGCTSFEVVLQSIVREIVEHFQREEVTWRRYVYVPIED